MYFTNHTPILKKKIKILKENVVFELYKLHANADETCLLI